MYAAALCSECYLVWPRPRVILLGLDVVNLGSIFGERVECLQDDIVQRMVIADDHAGIDNISFEVDFCCPQGQFFMIRISLEPALVQGCSGLFPMIFRLADVQHHGSLMAEKLLDNRSDHLEHIWISGCKGVVGIVNEEMVGTFLQEVVVVIEAHTINDSVFCDETENHVLQLDYPIG